MKILCVSDTTSSLAFSSQVRDIFKDTDLILSCGDMPVESHDYLSTMLKSDVYYVYGNHNLETFQQEMDRDGQLFLPELPPVSTKLLSFAMATRSATLERASSRLLTT